MTAALSDDVLVTIIVAGLVAFLAALVVGYRLSRRGEFPFWRRLRVGVFLERDNGDGPCNPKQ